MCAAHESLELQPELQKKEVLQCSAISFEKLLLWMKFAFIERKQPRNQKSTILEIPENSTILQFQKNN